MTDDYRQLASSPFNLSFTRYPVNVILPYKEGRQSHRQILTTNDQNLTVLDFLDSHLTRTTLLGVE